MMKGKIIILSAPSGSGKSSIIARLIDKEDLQLGFSISATSRSPRGEERDGVEYYFLSPEEFDRRVKAGDFVEWEEVYAGTCYGTLRSEVERVVGCGRNLIMDVDVKGGVRLKEIFGDDAISIFIMPPSVEELERRLRGRATDSDDTIRRRLAKAEYELTFAPRYDTVIVNDQLDRAAAETETTIRRFITPSC